MILQSECDENRGERSESLEAASFTDGEDDGLMDQNEPDEPELDEESRDSDDEDDSADADEMLELDRPAESAATDASGVSADRALGGCDSKCAFSAAFKCSMDSDLDFDGAEQDGEDQLGDYEPDAYDLVDGELDGCGRERTLSAGSSRTRITPTPTSTLCTSPRTST